MAFAIPANLAIPQVAASKIIGILLAILLLAGGGFWAGHHVGGLAGKAAVAEQQAEEGRQAMAAVRSQLELQAKGQEALAKQLAKVPSRETIQQLVEANPSGCALPAPVADGLRKQAAKARHAYPGP